MLAYPQTASGERLALPQVTLCAITSVNVAATVRALEASLGQIDFADCILFTDAAVQTSHPEIRVAKVARIISSAAYSDFLLTRLIDYVASSHCLVIQWDGHVIDAGLWLPEFLDYDYIGASWPQFDDDHDVGNGGFSLRSRRLMEACCEPGFKVCHPEDVAICRANRELLERRGMRFAPAELADLFAAERAGDPATSFGYHGVFNMPRALGMEKFWQIYRELDDLGTVRHDFGSILWQVGRSPRGIRRAGRMIADRLLHTILG